MPDTQHNQLVAAFTHLGGTCEPTRGNLYVNVLGPAGATSPRGAALVIVQDDGSITFRSERLSKELKAPLRPGARPPPLRNLQNYGDARWNISSEELRRRFKGADEMARAVVEAFRKAGLRW